MQEQVGNKREGSQLSLPRGGHTGTPGRALGMPGDELGHPEQPAPSWEGTAQQ